MCINGNFQFQALKSKALDPQYLHLLLSPSPYYSLHALFKNTKIFTKSPTSLSKTFITASRSLLLNANFESLKRFSISPKNLHKKGLFPETPLKPRWKWTRFHGQRSVLWFLGTLQISVFFFLTSTCSAIMGIITQFFPQLCHMTLRSPVHFAKKLELRIS